MWRAPYIQVFPLLEIGMGIMLTPQGREENYAYSSRVRGKICLLIGVRTLPLLKSTPNNPPNHIHLVIYIGVWYFASCFMIGKAHGCGTFPKCRVELLVLGGPFLILRIPRILGLYPTHTTYSCCGIQQFKISTYPG